ncbi:MAG TPA: NAD(P)H-binding protein [Conexibacter sp.]|jgi:hypothetical protein
MSDLIVFGAGGRLGRVVIDEAVRRGLAVTAVVRDPDAHAQLAAEGVAVLAADAASVDEVATVAAGHTTAISALGPYPDSAPGYLTAIQLAVFDGVARAGVERLLFVGGAGSLTVDGGGRLVDQPGFPDVAKPTALAHADALDAIRDAETTVDWLVISPPAIFDPTGQRSGSYRLGGTSLLLADDGASHGSYADYAVALLDEVERPAHHRAHICVGD